MTNPSNPKSKEEAAREYADKWVEPDVYTGKRDEMSHRRCRVDFIAGWDQCADGLAERIFTKIEHGDMAHREWLKTALVDFFEVLKNGNGDAG